ncbi:MAG: BT4734/BF3469 family protein [Chitinophagaceae bacterium]
MQKQISLYKTHSDNIGRPETYRDILLCHCAKDLPTIMQLKKLDRNSENYNQRKLDLKKNLQAFTPAALLASKAKDQVEVIHRTGVMQLDFDYADIHEYDIEELKRCVFSLPFVGFCGLSCSGDGFYALALIAEPERLADYAEHCFCVLLDYGIKADKSKGKKVENLRYVSYDANMLIRNKPQPLHVNNFKKLATPKPQFTSNPTGNITGSNNRLVLTKLAVLQQAQVGSRWETVQNVSYTLGGLNDNQLLNEIVSTINYNQAFNGEEDKYIKCAKDCFNAGLNKPI